MIIKSHSHKYKVTMSSCFDVDSYNQDLTFFVIDKNVYNLYKDNFLGLKSSRLFLLDATEENKTIETALEICERFTAMSAKKNAVLVSIGGGITQDITGFVANILYRGITWFFYPTTILAACDSCIGSKTSLNFKSFKNLLGTFYPPSEIIIVPSCFKTLTKADIASGLGEIVKFNVMSGEANISKLEKDLDSLISLDSKTIKKYIF